MRALRQVRLGGLAALQRLPACFAVVLTFMGGSMAAPREVPFSTPTPEWVLARQPTESPQPPDEPSSPPGDAAAPAVGDARDKQRPGDRAPMRRFRPTDQVPAGSGVSFPADI